MIRYITFKLYHRGGSRTASTSKMERFVIIVNGFQPLTITTKCSIFDVAAVLDPPLMTCYVNVSRTQNKGKESMISSYVFVR